tara:strand:+ start:2028 stop:4082 length:2055 start_codon:yes stop_codon:yes gene_type:complete
MKVLFLTLLLINAMNFKFNIQKQEIYTLNEAEKTKYPKNWAYRYSFGKVGEDPIERGNSPNARTHIYGASMNKPILAFVNLILAREYEQGKGKKKIRALSPEELDRVIAYTKKSNWSNKVNRALSKAWPNYRKYRANDPEVKSGAKKVGQKSNYPISAADKKYYDKTSKEIGVNHREAREVLERFGLAKDLPAVSWGHNRQSPEGYGKFMSLLVNFENDPNSEYHSEAKTILKHVRKRQGGYPGVGLQNHLNKQLEKEGWGKNLITSMYGKGGKTTISGTRTLNYSVVINDKYVLTIYGQSPEGAKSHDDMRKYMHKLSLGIIKKNLKVDSGGALMARTASETIKIPGARGAPAYEKYRRQALDVGFDPDNLSREQRTFLSYATFGPESRRSMIKERDIKAMMLVHNYDYETAEVFVDEWNKSKDETGNVRDYYKNDILEKLISHPEKEKLEKQFVDDRNYEELHIPEPKVGVGVSEPEPDPVPEPEPVDVPDVEPEPDEDFEHEGPDWQGEIEPEPESELVNLPGDKGGGLAPLQENEDIYMDDEDILELELYAEQGDKESACILEAIYEHEEQLLKEQTAATPSLIKVDIALKYEKEFSFYGNVLNQIRSIKGVAIAKASDMGVVAIGPNKKMVLMHLKFMPDRPLHQYLTYLRIELKKIKDNDGDRIIATQIKGVPKEIEI